MADEINEDDKRAVQELIDSLDQEDAALVEELGKVQAEVAEKAADDFESINTGADHLAELEREADKEEESAQIDDAKNTIESM